MAFFLPRDGIHAAAACTCTSSGSNIAWSEIGLSSICLVPLSVEAARVPRKGTPELFVDYGVDLTMHLCTSLLDAVRSHHQDKNE